MLAVSVIVTALMIIGIAGYQEVYGQAQSNIEVKTIIEHDGQEARYNKLIHMQGNIYALLYESRGTCYVKTFEITDDTITQIATISPGRGCVLSDMTKLNDNRVVAFQGTRYLKLYQITDSGAISLLSTSTYSLGIARQTNLETIKEDTVLLVYSTGSRVSLENWKIGSDNRFSRVGNFTGDNTTNIDTIMHDDDTIIVMLDRSTGRTNSYNINLTSGAITKNDSEIQYANTQDGGGIVRLTDNSYAVAYVSSNRGGAALSSFSFGNNNVFGTGVTTQYDPAAVPLTFGSGGQYGLEHISNNRIIVAWPATGTIGAIATFTFDGVGGFTQVTDSYLKFADRAKHIDIVQDGGKTIVAYAGLDDDGYIALITERKTAPASGTLSAHSLSDSSIRFSYIPGASGTDVPNSFDLRCKESTQNQWRPVKTMAPIPAGNIYVVSGLLNDITLECQWRQNSDHGEGEWSNTASATTVRPQYQDPPVTSGPIKAFEQAVNNFGGIYFGLSLFPFLVMLFGAMATAKTTGIFTIITLMLMGIIHASGYYQWPEWYWALMTLFAIPLVLSARRG